MELDVCTFFEQIACAIIYYWRKSKEKLQRIEVQDSLHPKPDKSDLKQQLKQNTKHYMNNIEPIFTFKHNQQIKDGRSSTYTNKQS